jgi:hypothetical protein
MKKLLIFNFILISISINAQLAIGYNAGVFQNKLSYFEMLNYENGLRNNGEKFIYSPLLHGLHVGFPLIRDKNKDNMMMEYTYSIKGTKSNLAKIDTSSSFESQYKIRIATHSIIFSRPIKQWKIGAGLDFSFIRLRKNAIVDESNPESPFKWKPLFQTGVNFGGTIFFSYRPKKVNFIEFRPFYNWHAIKKMELIREGQSLYPVAFKFSNVGLNVNVLISKRKK